MSLNSMHTDEQLLSLLQNDDELAFTEIYQRYHRAIYAYLLDFVKIPQLAEDLVHEVFMKIWEIRRRLVINTSFSAYLYRICHNKALDALQKIAQDRKLRHEVMQRLEPSQDELDSVLRRTRHYEQLLKAAIAIMPPQRQKVFLLCREEGKTYDQAAQVLGISRNTVKEHMAQSLRFLRRYFSENGETVFMLTLLLSKKFF